MPKTRKTNRLAPSIRQAQARVRWVWYGSLLHGAALAGVGVHRLAGEDPSWIAGLVLLGAGGIVPVLGRAAYRGNSFTAFLLLVSVLAPPAALFFLGRELRIALAGLLFAPAYYLGLKGAIGLRGRRGSRRGGTAGKDRRR